MTEPDFEFDSVIADELARRWLVVELLATRLLTLERDALGMAIHDAKACQLRLLQSVRCLAPGEQAEPIEGTLGTLQDYAETLDAEDHVDEADPRSTAFYRHPQAGPMARRVRRTYMRSEKIAGARLAAVVGKAEASRQLDVHESVLKGWMEKYPTEVALARAEAAPDHPSHPEPPSEPDAAPVPEPDASVDEDLVSDLEAELARPTSSWPQRPIERQPFDPETVRRRAAEGI